MTWAHCWAGVASSTDAAYDGEAAVQVADHIAKGVPGSWESTAGIGTWVERAVEEAVRTCFSHAARASEEMLQRPENSIEAYDRWADMDVACVRSPPFVPNLLSECQSFTLSRTQWFNPREAHLCHRT